MTIDLTQIALSIIALVSAVITSFIIPLLKSKLSVENGKVTQLQSDMLRLAITTAVTAAEQIFNSEEGQKKKAYVLALLESQGYPVDSSAIDAAIEACVLELHNELNKV